FISSAFGQNKPLDLVRANKNKFKDISEPILIPNSDSRSFTIPEECKNPSLFSINTSELKNIHSNGPSAIRLTLPDASRKDVILELVEIKLTEKNEILTEPARSAVKVGQGRHYRGIIQGDEKSIVAMSFFENEVMGFIASPSLEG